MSLNNAKSLPRPTKGEGIIPLTGCENPQNQDNHPAQNTILEQPKCTQLQPVTTDNKRNKAPKRKAQAADLRGSVTSIPLKMQRKSSKARTQGRVITVRLSNQRRDASPGGAATKKKVIKAGRSEKAADNTS